MPSDVSITSAELIAMLRDARARTLELVEGLTDEQLTGPRLEIVNPLRWEIGHVAWFHERWVRRHLDGKPSFLPNADDLYDSINIHHDVRWDLPLLPLEDTLRYMQQVLDYQVDRLEGREPPSADDAYFYRLGVFHEDMHDEAFTYSRQTLAYPEPAFALARGGAPEPDAGPLAGDAEVPGGTFMLGAARDEPFVFDNEKWAHPVEVAPFRIARAQVSNAEFAAFVDDGGYRRPELWSEEGWRWREALGLEHPVYWVPAGGGAWRWRRFDREAPLAPHAAVVHVSWYEAEAYCRWAERRLPSEAEWEMAAACEPDGAGGLAPRKRRFPWGEEPPTPARANLDGRAMGAVDVGAHAAGDSAFGCRQMVGNVWEWTATDFAPYPGFVPDPYKEYSQPMFGQTKVLRGGAWATRARMLRNTWRNFFAPARYDVLAGFRTCAL